MTHGENCDISLRQSHAAVTSDFLMLKTIKNDYCILCTHFHHFYSPTAAIKWAVTCDFQQCGILTFVDSDEHVQPPFKLRNSQWCSVSSLTIIECSSDKQRLWSDCAYAQADLRLCWSLKAHCWKSHVTAQMWDTTKCTWNNISLITRSTTSFYQPASRFIKPSLLVLFWTNCLRQNAFAVSTQRNDTNGVHLGANLCWNPDFLGPCLKCMLSPFYVPNTNLTSDGSCIRHIRVPLKWNIVYLRVTSVSEKHTTDKR